MGDYVLFQMSSGHRQQLISSHKFYVAQAQKRLFSQFNDISAEAEQAAEDWLSEHQTTFNPDVHDPSDFKERAHDEGIEFYGLLKDMHDNVRLSVISGMFHEWEKNLREWVARELSHVSRESTKIAIWRANFSQILDLLECLAWPVCSQSYYEGLNSCRLVVNVYKHGFGQSFYELRDAYPRFLRNPIVGSQASKSWERFLNYTDLVITDEDFLEFSSAIIAFWNDVPESVCQSKVTGTPLWLSKALEKDKTR